MEPKEIQEALKRLIAEQASAQDLTILREAHAAGSIQASGERSVAIGRDAANVTIQTGDTILQISPKVWRLIQAEEAQEAKQFADAIRKELLRWQEEIEKPPDYSRNPYRDFSPFDKADEWRFRGRQAHVDALTKKLTAARSGSRLVMLRSPDGAGKTSLLQAGVFPRLARDGHLPLLVEVSETALIPTVRRELLTDIDSLQTIKNKPLCKLLELAAQVLMADKHIVVMLDQFEEFFKQPAEYQDAFIQELTTCLKDTQSKDRWLISINSSAESHLYTLFPQLINYVSDHYPLPLLRKDEALQAITQPASRCGITLGEGLAEGILDELGGGAFAPFELEIILHTLAGGYEEPIKKNLTLHDLKAIGGASEFSKRYLDVTLKDKSYLDSEQQRYAWELLAVLARQTGHTASTKTLQNEMKDLELKDDPKPILEKLHIKRLVQYVEDEDSYKLANERLLPRIEEWRQEQSVKKKAREETARQFKLVRTSALRGLFGGALGFGLAVAITWWVHAKNGFVYILTILLSMYFGGVAGAIFTLALDLANRTFKIRVRWLVSGITGGLVYVVLLLAFYLLRGDPDPLNWATVIVEGAVWGFAIGACTAWAMDNTKQFWLALLGISIIGGLLLLLLDATFGMAFSHRASPQNPREAADAWSLLAGGMLMAFLLAYAALLGQQAVKEKAIV